MSSQLIWSNQSLEIVRLVVSIDIEATAWIQRDLAIAATGNQQDVAMCTASYRQLRTQRKVNQK